MDVWDCVKPESALEVTLNATALSRPNGLYITLTSDLISASSVVFKQLIDSGSSHGFIDSIFVDTHAIPTRSIPAVTLDGTSPSVLTHSVSLPICFPSGEVVD